MTTLAPPELTRPDAPPEVVPLPAAAALLICAVVALGMTKRMTR